MNELPTTLPNLLPTLHALSRADKLRVIQELAGDLAKEEGIACLEAGSSCPVWTPLDAYDAASSLMKMLESERGTDGRSG